MLDSFAGAETDQAAGLRHLFAARTVRAARVIAFVSGREACGRTTLLVRTAAALAKAGHGVLIIDENRGTDNIHSAFGIKARHDLLDLVRGGCPIERLVQPVAPRLGVVAAARFAAEVQHVDTMAAGRLDAALGHLQEGNSFVLIDCAARGGQHLSLLALAAPHMAVLVAVQSSAIIRAYTLIKRLAQERGCDGFNIAITGARTGTEALAVFRNMRRTANEHLGVRLDYLGSARVPTEDHLAGALQGRLSLASASGDGSGFLRFAEGAAASATGPRSLASTF